MSELNDIANLDKVIHEPARLAAMSILYAVDEVDFLYLLRETGLTKGNLSAHMSRLEKAKYIQVKKGFVGKTPQTLYHLTDAGRQAFEDYRKKLEDFLTSL